PAKVLFLWGNGTGAFTLQYAIGPSSEAIAAGDFNGDGISDVVIPDDSIAATVILGRHDRKLPQIASLFPEIASSMSVGDVNGDGLPAIVGDGLIGWNNGNLQFSFTVMNETAGAVFAVADVNRDGRLDLITRNGTSLNLGNRQFMQIANNGAPVSTGARVAIG